MFIIKKILHIGKLISCVVLLTTLSTENPCFLQERNA